MKKQFLLLTLLTVSIHASDENTEGNLTLAKLIEDGKTTILHDFIRYHCKQHATQELSEDTKNKINDIRRFGIDINTQERQEPHYTPLHIATQYNALPLVTFLLITHKARVNYDNKLAPHPLMIACENRNEAMIKILLEHGAQIEKGYSKVLFSLKAAGMATVPPSYITPLMEACHTNNDNKPIIDLLLSHGADIKSVFTCICTKKYYGEYTYELFFDLLKKVSIHNAATIIGHINDLSAEKKAELMAHAKKQMLHINN